MALPRAIRLVSLGESDVIMLIGQNRIWQTGEGPGMDMSRWVWGAVDNAEQGSMHVRAEASVDQDRRQRTRCSTMHVTATRLRASSSPADLSARRHDGSLILAFSGTDVRSPASIGISLDLRLTAIEAEFFPGMDVKSVQVHRGFYKCFRKVKDDVLAVVNAEIDKGARFVILAGYSLGEHHTRTM